MEQFLNFNFKRRESQYFPFACRFPAISPSSLLEPEKNHVAMAASTIVTPRIPRFFQSCHRSTFPSSWRLVERTRRRPTRTRNELNSSSSETWPSSSSSVHHPSLLLSPPPTRRWMSGTRSSSSSSSISSKGNGSTHVDDTEERRQDHRHCVDMVRTSDYEGYCKCIILSYIILISSFGMYHIHSSHSHSFLLHYHSHLVF